MKLAHKLALALLLGVFTVVAAFAAWRIQREMALMDGDVLRDHRLLSVTAAAAIVEGGSRHDAIEVVKRIDASRENVTVRFVSFAEDAPAELRPLRTVPGRLENRTGPLQLPAKLPAKAPGERPEDGRVTYVGTPVLDDPEGAIQVSESLAPRSAYVKESILTIVASSVLIALVCGVIVASIGTRIVGRPVGQLIFATRQIGAGNFGVVPTLKRRDELGELARALHQMSEQLAEQRSRTQEAADARIFALEQLRHAERLATLGQMASVLAHELGTPLNVIGGHAKMMATRRIGSEAVEESAQTIGAQCERMTKIIHRILDFARRKPGRPEDVRLAEVIQSSCDLLAPLAESQGVTLRCACSVDGARVSADPDQLEQVITNITLNAIQASQSGDQVEVSAETTSARSPAGGENVPCALVRVVDHGPGMSSEVLSRAFEPFFTTKSPGQGTGLGLSIAREIVEEHGGWFSVTSREGEGTRFDLYFPESTKHGQNAHR